MMRSRASGKDLGHEVMDVDGKVIEAEELLHRVHSLVSALEADGVVTSAGAPTEVADPSRQGHLDLMRQFQSQLVTPLALRGPGIRGSVGFVARRAARRMVRWYVEPRWETQRAFNDQTWTFLTRQDQEFAVEVAGVRAQSAAVRGQLVELKLMMYSALERLSHLRVDIDRLEETGREHDAALDRALAGRVAAQEEALSLRREVAALMERLGVTSVHGVAVDYAAFEDRFRGQSDEIRQGQERYLSLIPRLDAMVVDIGCGRGEMVELLIEAGFDAIGVDTDTRMVQSCVARGLPVTQDEGIHFLEMQADESLAGIVCIQVVEHLTTTELERLLRLAYAKLMQGGSLVVETINPRSSFALSNHFYADTSHTRPVHPETLRFICEQIGFGRVSMEERSLHPAASQVDRLPDDAVGQAVQQLIETVFGYQDYFVAANK